MPTSLEAYLSQLPVDEARIVWRWLEDNMFAATNMINIIVDSHAESFGDFAE